MKNRYIYILIIALFISGCNWTNSNKQKDNDTEIISPVTYAKWFTIEKGERYTCVNVKNPWDTTTNLHRYILVQKGRDLPKNLPEGTLIRTPLKKVVVYSSVHCGIMDALGLEEALSGVCESRYVDIEFVKKGLKNGKISDLGEASSPDVEKIIDISPDAIIASPLESMGYGRIEKIGIPLIESVDYMEVTPLGRAEWIRFYALFFDKIHEADSIFNTTAQSYNNIKKIVKNVKFKPTVISETKTGSVWYIPGGQSYMANFFADAGANYPWKDNQNSGSIPVSFETVLEYGENADIWVMKYNKPNDMSYDDLKKEYSGYEYFSAYKNKTIFMCNTGKVPYYEELPIHPDYLLKDLVWVFHPELFSNYNPRYYKKMLIFRDE
ncbi:MAG: ABC transporter substrate-binding protein [Bacteroidales bacterium]|nr:ABC transporter substrate-binding protein [Bacteroidales bacterium]